MNLLCLIIGMHILHTTVLYTFFKVLTSFVIDSM